MRPQFSIGGGITGRLCEMYYAPNPTTIRHSLLLLQTLLQRQATHPSAAFHPADQHTHRQEMVKEHMYAQRKSGALGLDL